LVRGAARGAGPGGVIGGAIVRGRAADVAWILAAAASVALGVAAVYGPVLGQLLTLLILCGVVAGLVLVFLRTDLLVPLIVATTPLEISKLWIPFLRAPTDWYGYQVSLLDAGRLAILLAAAIWILRGLLGGRLTIPRSTLWLWSAMLVGLIVVSLAYTLDPIRGRNEALRHAFNLSLMVIVASLTTSEARLRLAVVAWVLVGIALSALAVWQQLTGIAFWNDKLVAGALWRANTTFADPNTFASFLNVGIAFCLGFVAARGERLGSWGAGLVLLSGGLIATFSRSGWLAMALVAVVGGLAFARSWRAVGLLAAMLVGGAGVVLAVPSIVDRLSNLTTYETVSVRPELISAGLTIFAENPLVGLGIGSFQLAVATEYRWAYPFWWYVTASHTSFVTTAAELGIVGLVAAAGVLATALIQAQALARDRALPARLRAHARGLILALLVLIAAGQTTGALFEEPYVWIVLGMVVALRRLAAPSAVATISNAALTLPDQPPRRESAAEQRGPRIWR
jgi:putative inorganic carbon (HCO3(-)) transporter